MTDLPEDLERLELNWGAISTPEAEVMLEANRRRVTDLVTNRPPSDQVGVDLEPDGNLYDTVTNDELHRMLLERQLSSLGAKQRLRSDEGQYQGRPCTVTTWIAALEGRPYYLDVIALHRTEIHDVNNIMLQAINPTIDGTYPDSPVTVVSQQRPAEPPMLFGPHRGHQLALPAEWFEEKLVNNR